MRERIEQILQKLYLILRGNFYRFISKNDFLFYTRYASDCKRCPYNSKNIEKLTIWQKAWNFFFGEYCTDCGCPLQAKLREPLSECPKGYWGQDIKTK